VFQPILQPKNIHSYIQEVCTIPWKMVSVLQIFKKCWVSLWAPEDGTVFNCHSCTWRECWKIIFLIKMQWSKERNYLAVESVKGLAIVKYKFRHFTCVAFHSYLMKNPDILQKIRSTEKYSWFKLEHSDWNLSEKL
jgi:hypothetical protein